MPQTHKKESKVINRVKIFHDLQRFLQTEHVEIIGLEKKSIENWYLREYTRYKKQIAPGVTLPSFCTLMQSVQSCGVAHFEGTKLALGSAHLDVHLNIEGAVAKQKKPRKIRTEDVQSSTPEAIVIVTQSDQPGNGSNRPSQPSESGSMSSLPGKGGSLHSHPGKGSNLHSQPRKGSHLSNQPLNTVAGNTDSKPPHQSFMRHARYAVDQHLTFKEGLARVVNEPDFKGDKEEWKFIGNTGKGYYCTLCQSKLSSWPEAEQHITGRKHRLSLSVNILHSKREKLIAGFKEISINANVECNKDGIIFLYTEEDEVSRMDFNIINTSDVDVELAHCEMMKTMCVFTFQDIMGVTDGKHFAIIKPGEMYTIHVCAHSKNIGSYHCPIMFHFFIMHEGSKKAEYVLRYLHLKTKNSMIDELNPTAPFKKLPRKNQFRGRVEEVIPGIKLKSFLNALERPIKLEEYMVSDNMSRMINRGLHDTSGLSEEQIANMHKLKNMLESDLDMSQYESRFSALLHFEEVQMDVDIRKYDMENVTMKRHRSNSQLLVLEVPGLSENRPSVLRGDCLYVRVIDKDGKLSKKQFQGYIHDVEQNELALGFHKSFSETFINNQKHSVQFVFNRLPLKLQHRACQMAKQLNLDNLLFPTAEILNRSIVPLPDLILYNNALESNEQQRCAVQHIVAGTSSPAPYIIFGPPGTGKTVTIVEAIKQIWKTLPTCNILVCTPSNSAADLITSRLLQHIPKAEILRINANSRAWLSVSEQIREVCSYNDTHQFTYPPKQVIGKYRIVVTTLITAGRLVSANFPANHFSHVFIDEAGHAVEPEALIALSGIIGSKSLGQVVIAGDPKQLGPILRSPLAIKYGLDISLLERYMEYCDLYRPSESNDGYKHYDESLITKLLKNYRSHPAILHLPNKQFYDSELLTCADEMDREKLCRWEGLPQTGFPLVFHGVVGEDMREERSPSFFNPQEVSIVIKYVEDLMNCKKGGMNLKQSDIGIISPYRKQVQKIQQILRRKNLNNISVGSVEEFQGQERTVIIVSTVRSKPEYLSFDMQFKLGFLRNPKRFNVTVTRAKALLIVVGNPNTLSGDEYWKELIDYCEFNGGYRGSERLIETDELEDLVQRLANIEMINDECQLLPEIQSKYNEQAWRSDV